MTRLSQELQAAFASEDDIDMLSVDKLPYLCAVTEESLRMFPPATNAQPRITPPEGNIVLGERIPGNVSSVSRMPQPLNDLNLMTSFIDRHQYSAKSNVPKRKTLQGCD